MNVKIIQYHIYRTTLKMPYSEASDVAVLALFYSLTGRIMVLRCPSVRQ